MPGQHDDLMPLVYDELRRVAERYIRRERPGQTLQATALVNEAYVRLANERPREFANKTHFLAIAALSRVPSGSPLFAGAAKEYACGLVPGGALNSFRSSSTRCERPMGGSTSRFSVPARNATATPPIVSVVATTPVTSAPERTGPLPIAGRSTKAAAFDSKPRWSAAGSPIFIRWITCTPFTPA